MLRSTLAQSTRLASAAAVASSSSAARFAVPAFAAAASSSRMAAVGAVQKRSYHEKVLDHYTKPRNVRRRQPAFCCRGGEEGVVEEGEGSARCGRRTPRNADLTPFPSNLAFLQVGSMDKTDQDVGTGLVGAPGACPPVCPLVCSSGARS